MKQINPLVSIHMITYNHEKYIAQAIDGVLMQETNFEFELIICNDCSSDNTEGVILKYIKDHQNRKKIKYFKHEKNIGMMPNSLFALSQCNSKYIALCEGDDYWIDNKKLQKQVDFLEAHSDFAICFTNGYYISEENNFLFNKSNILLNNRKESCEILQDDLLVENVLLTLSTMYRNNQIIYPDWLMKVKLGDWCYHILNSKFGKIWYINDFTAIYRKHNNGVWANNSFQKQLLDYIITCDILIKNLPEFSKKLRTENIKRIFLLLKWDYKYDKKMLFSHIWQFKNQLTLIIYLFSIKKL